MGVGGQWLIGGDFSFSQALFESLKVFSLSDNFQAIADAAKKPVNCQLWAARWLGALVSFSAVFAVLGKVFATNFARLSAASWKNHVVIIGGGEFAQSLSGKFVQNGHECLLLSNKITEASKTKNLITLPFTHISEKGEVFEAIKNANKIIIIAEKDVSALEIAVRTQKLFPETEIIVRVNDAYQARNFELLQFDARIRAFSMPEAGACEITRRHFPFLIAQDLGQTRIHAAIVGDDLWVEALICEIALATRTLKYGKPAYSVFVRNAESFKQKILSRYPEIEMEMTLSFHGFDEMALSNLRKNGFDFNSQLGSITAIYCAFFDSETSLATAMDIKAEAVNRNAFKAPIFVRLDDGDGLKRRKVGEELGENELVPFGSIDDICIASDIISDHTEKAAMWWHGSYEAIQSNKKNTNAKWAALIEDKRNSNRRAVKHIYAKLFEAGFDLRPWMMRNDVWANWPVLKTGEKFLPDYATKRAQSVLEHERWNLERRLLGWKFGAGKQDPIRKTHPCLIDFEALDPEIAKYDTELVEGLETKLQRDEDGMGRT